MDRREFETSVLEYAQIWASQYVKKVFSSYAEHLREDMVQDSLLTILETLPTIENERGWKSYVQLRVGGAIKDFVKQGQGWQEESRSAVRAKNAGNTGYIFARQCTSTNITVNGGRQETEMGLDWVLAQSNIFAPDVLEKREIRWDLVSHMARIDRGLNYFARWLRGHSYEDIALMVGRSRASVGVHIEAFISRFDDPEWAEDPWLKQAAYAFNICDLLGLPDRDQSEVLKCPIGWSETPVNLDDIQGPEPIEHCGESLNV